MQSSRGGPPRWLAVAGPIAMILIVGVVYVSATQESGPSEEEIEQRQLMAAMKKGPQAGDPSLGSSSAPGWGLSRTEGDAGLGKSPSKGWGLSAPSNDTERLRPKGKPDAMLEGNGDGVSPVFEVSSNDQQVVWDFNGTTRPRLMAEIVTVDGGSADTLTPQIGNQHDSGLLNLHLKPGQYRMRVASSGKWSFAIYDAKY